MRTLHTLLRLFAACAALLAWASPAHALPSFARQTGQACTACHIGAFGPQLTPNGMKFKIGGYTDWDGSSTWMPMSAHAIAGYTKVRGSKTAEVDKVNSDRLNEASIFAAGRVNDHIGGFVQATWDGIGHEWGLDHTDLRLVDARSVGGKELVYGLSFNNNPTVQDPFNTLTVWGFPYTGSELAGGPSAASLIGGGRGLEHTVGGLTLYGFLDNSIYAEVGTYRTLAPRTQVALGEGKDSDPGRLGDGTIYWRTAYFRDLKRQAFAVGLFGMNGGLHSRGAVDPATVGNFHDIGVDAMYQYLGGREHIGTLNTSYVRETASSQGERGHLNEFKANASYFYRNTYGLSLGYFSTTGDSIGLYTADPTKSPNSRGFITELSWTPLGKEDSWMAPWANVRVGLQYINFQRLDGEGGSYAHGNNTLFGYVWTAF
ncbi:MAG: cytochrome C [Rhodocyclaceae bacterium]|nr:cytochrome C [Rhodocyclaceae bacterium]